MPEVRVLEHYCKGCGLCVEVCPQDILYLSETVNRQGLHIIRVRAGVACTGCGNCVAMCPDAALEIIP